MKRTALITGASSGIGLELSKLVARDGHDLVLSSRSEDQLRRIAEQLQSNHRIKVTVLPVDLSEVGSAEKLADQLKEREIHPDILINNAGYGLLGEFNEIPVDQLMRMLQLNMMELTRLTYLLLPAMKRQNHGRIMNVASTAAFQPGPFMAAYYASKAYVLSFSQAIAEELSHFDIYVSTLCPGPTNTKFQDRAGMQQSPLFKIMPVQDAPTVARTGYKGLMRDKRVVIPGLVNKLLVFSIRFAPRGLVTKMVRRMQESRQPDC